MVPKRFFRILAALCAFTLLLAACSALPFEVKMKDKPTKESLAPAATAQAPAAPSAAENAQAPTVQIALPIVQNAPPTPTAYVYQGAQPSSDLGGV